MPNQQEGGPVAKKGDLIVVNAARVGGPPREGEIIEVVEGELRVQYRVRWNDGHESLFAPAAGSARIEPARDRKSTGRSQVTKSKKSLEKATTRKKAAEKKPAAKATTAKRSSQKR
jgi:hypothetical protein